MILEAAILDVIPGREEAFEADFQQAQKLIAAIDGYVSHQLQRCLETPNRYILLVHWESVEAHIVGFRASDEYRQWKALLHHHYDPFPTVEHYAPVFDSR